MRTFSSLLIVASIALSANASSFLKREGPAVFEQCSQDVTMINTKLIAFTDIFTVYKGESVENKAANENKLSDDGTKSLNAYTELSEAIFMGADHCCSIPGNLGAEDTKTLLNTIEVLLPNVQKTMDTLTAKYPQLTQASFTRDFVSFALEEIDEPTKKLAECLIARAPQEEQVKTRGYADSVYKSIDNAKVVYDDTKNTPPADKAPAAAGAPPTTAGAPPAPAADKAPAAGGAPPAPAP